MGRGFKNKELYKMTQMRVNYWMQRMLRLASSAIRWKGFPEYIDTVYLENCLTRTGSSIVVKDEIADWYGVGQNASTGLLNIYAYPKNRSIIFRNGEQQWYTPNDSVIIWNNSTRSSDLWIYRMIAEDLADFDMAIRVNVNSQKTMPIIPLKETQVLSGENLMQDINNNQPYRFIDPQGIDIESFKNALMFDNRKSFTADQIIQVQRELWNRALTIIGINNVNVEKRERVNVFETNSNLDEIAVMREDRLNARRFAAQQMSNILGLEVTVDYVSNIKNGIGGDGNGKVYSAIEDDFGTEMA